MHALSDASADSSSSSPCQARRPALRSQTSNVLLRPLTSPATLLKEVDSPLAAITPPAVPLVVDSNLGERYRPTPLPSPALSAERSALEEESSDDDEDPSPPPEPHPHPHPEPDPRPATPGTPPGRDHVREVVDEEDGEAYDAGQEAVLPSLYTSRHPSVSSSRTFSSTCSSTDKDQGEFIEDVADLLSASHIEHAPAVFSDGEDEDTFGDELVDEDRPWIYGRNAAERRYSDEMRTYVLGVVDQLMRSSRDGTTTTKRKKRGSIRGRESSVVFET